MNPPRHLLLILSLTLSATLSHGADPEEERLRGFAEHQKNFKRFDEARETGKRAFLEEEEQWLSERDRDLLAYKKNKPKPIVMDESSAEYRAWMEKKKAEDAAYEAQRREYSEIAHKRKALDREAKNLPTFAQELGLDEERPRFDFKKRKFAGGTGTGGSSSGSGFSRGGGSSPSNSSFPPPPTFDDFNDGYVPAPNISPDDFGDVPPPPPPPMPMPPGFDGGFSNGSEFIPPPPPPPGNFDSGDF